jgi:DNA-binding response OmpR family regulator
MSLNLHLTKAPANDPGPIPRRMSHADNPVVLMVKDREDTRSEMKRVLELNGYRVIDTDNGQDATKRAQYIYPDLLLVDLDVPLLYGMVAARQIVKKAQLGIVPVVIVTSEPDVDAAALLEVGVRRNEYVTRLADYDQLEHLLDYLLPAPPPLTKTAAPVSRSPQ